MCRKVKSCILLGLEPSAWSRTAPLQPPSWFEEQLDIFRESAEHAAQGRKDEAIRILRTTRNAEMRVWFIEHGQMSGGHRSRQLTIKRSTIPESERDPEPEPRRYEKQVFQRDSYVCRFCGLRTLSKEVVAAFERAVGSCEFPTTGSNEEQHGIVHGFKVVADHVIPVACGGRTNLENLVTACPSCNYGKYYYTLEQLGLDDPRNRSASSQSWDGLLSLVAGLKNHALKT